MSLAAVILAAGQGTRMKSSLPKVLHRVAGRPMIEYVLDAVIGAGVNRVVVVTGFGADQVEAVLDGRVEIVRQEQQLGTGHALMQVRPVLAGLDGDILVVYGDTPLIEAGLLTRLATAHRAGDRVATVLTSKLDDPHGYGRVIRNEDGAVVGIVEQKDAKDCELAIREINTGIYCFKASYLFDALSHLTPVNAQGEYYLTDCITCFSKAGLVVKAVCAPEADLVLGINDRLQLARAEAFMRKKVVERLMEEGVTIIDPSSTFIDEGVVAGRDTIIYPFTIIEGRTVIGSGCRIGPGSRLMDAKLGNDIKVEHSIVMESSLEDGVTVGPYSYIRPGCTVGQGAKIGDFVELKKSIIGNGSKVPHLSYVGDATLGERVNIGAGTITCNYDGKDKWHTQIGSRAFIGSNTNLVAPVKIGEGAVTGAGSTITKDVPPGTLGVARSKQLNIHDWAARRAQSKNLPARDE